MTNPNKEAQYNAKIPLEKRQSRVQTLQLEFNNQAKLKKNFGSRRKLN